MDAPCIDHGRKGPNGYASKWTPGGRVTTLHRVVYAEHHGLDEATMGGVVMHTCDNRRCIQPLHLVLGTYLANMQDMVAKGRNVNPAGQYAPGAKLTQAEVDTIRQRYVKRCKRNGQKALAKEFDLDPSTVFAIVHNLTWKV